MRQLLFESRQSVRVAISILFVVGMLLGASASDSSPPDPGVAQIEDVSFGIEHAGVSRVSRKVLDGKSFLALPSDGFDPAVLAEFRDGRIAVGGCNTHSGEYQVSEGRMQYEVNMMAAMACDEPESLGHVLGVMMSSPTIRPDSDGSLILVSDGQKVVLRSALTALPVSPILGQWRVGVVAGSGWFGLETLQMTLAEDHVLISGPCIDATIDASVEDRVLTVREAIFVVPARCEDESREADRVGSLESFLAPPNGDFVRFDIVTTKYGIKLEPQHRSPDDFSDRGLDLRPLP